MLRELRIENLLLIERAELRLGPSLNVITGETGAGKTILAHSLDLLMGGRARPQIVRPGASEAWVEGAFDIPDDLFADEELAEIAERLPEDAAEIVLGRRVSASGRTAAFVAGRAASAADLRRLGARLLAFYGQHEHRKLTLASAQLEILDGFCGAEQLEQRGRHRAAFREAAGLRRELDEVAGRDGARERDLDLLRYELSEIEAAAPDPAELADLGAERERLRHADELRIAAGVGLAALSGTDEDGGGVSAQIAAAEAGLAGAGERDPRLGQIAERLAALSLELVDVATEIRGYLEGLEADPSRLGAVEERLDSLDRLTRKHGGSLESVLDHAEHCRAEIELLEGAEERTAELEAALEDAESRRSALAAELSARRRAAATELEDRVATELERLAMPGARVEVILAPTPGGGGLSGEETIEMRVAPNPGIAPAPLRDAASGGELSRVMLALLGLGESAGASSLVFDEVDAGIGGNTARVVGERLRELAASRQVLCITHLAQVASLAERHFRISKEAGKETTLATVERVEGEQLIGEICRMLGADGADEAASRHARELLAAAA